MANESPPNPKRAAFIFLIFVILFAWLGAIDGRPVWFGFAVLFLWLAVWAFLRTRRPRLDLTLELVGGLVLVGVGAITIWDREALLAMDSIPARSAGPLLVYVGAPVLILSGAFYAIRSAVRLAGRRS